MPDSTQSSDKVHPFPTAIDTTGGTGGGGGMEARVAKLQADVEHVQGDIGEIKRDLRALLVGGLVAGLGLMGMMAKGFGWLDGG